MTVTSTPDDAFDPAVSRTLPCGADVDELLEQVAAGHGDDLTDHQRGCVHCQPALRELRRFWSPVEAAAHTAVPVPRQLTASIVAAVRRRARDVWFTYENTDGGAIRIAARIVAVIARDAARQVPGVRVVLGRTSESKMARIVEKATLGHKHPHSAVGVLGRTAAVELAVGITYGEPAPDVARRIQAEVIAALRSDIGLVGVNVDVIVDDVLPRRGRGV